MQLRTMVSSNTDTSLPRMVILCTLTPFFIISSLWSDTAVPSTRAQAPILLFQPMTEWRTQLACYYKK